MNNQNKVAKWSLIIAIFVLLNLFFNVAVSLVYEEPNYEDYCPRSLELDPEKSLESLQKLDTCNENWQNATENYELKVFIILMIFGLITFVISFFLKANYVITTSLALAAVLDFIIASMRYWPSANEWLRLIILVIALSILIYIAIKKFKEK